MFAHFKAGSSTRKSSVEVFYEPEGGEVPFTVTLKMGETDMNIHLTKQELEGLYFLAQSALQESDRREIERRLS